MDVCIRCNGKRTYMGTGFMITDCELCNGSTVTAPSVDKIDRRSLSYRTAIKDIMDANKVGRDEAVKMFDEAYAKG